MRHKKLHINIKTIISQPFSKKITTMIGDGNRLSHTMSEEELNDVKMAIKSVAAKMPFLVNLNDDDVLSMNKISDGDKVFIADCMSEAKEAEALLPPYFKIVEIQKDNTLNDQLYEIEDTLFEMYQHVRRNRMLAADEAYSGVSTFYTLVKTAATSKTKIASAVAMYKRLQDYHLKKVETAKAKKRKAEAEKAAADAERTSEKEVTKTLMAVA